MSNAREVATQVLHRVDVDGAYAAAALNAELERAHLDSRDVGLATEIVYGTLRVIPRVDRAIRDHLNDPKRKLEPWTHAALRAAAYQLLFLSRVPAHAVVDETVRLARNKRGPKVGGFVNAVLRKLSAARTEEEVLARDLDVPDWFHRELTKSLGPERAHAFLEGRPLPPPLGLRVSAHADLDSVEEAIRASRPTAEIARGPVPRSLVVRAGGDPRTLPGFAEGRFTVQEVGAQIAGEVCAARSGDRVADVCAGRGGKALRFLHEVGAGGGVTAFDIDERKLEQLEVECKRLRLDAKRLTTEAVDLSKGTGGFGADFDLVVVDAPCTGLGTTHRRPEILLRTTAMDPPRMGELQLAILHKAASLVKPEGRLVYIVCSPTRAEGPRVASQFEALVTGFSRSMAAPSVGTRDPDGALRIGPWMSEADAYQVFEWKRER